MLPNRWGSTGSYRYGFQGQEKDDEIKGEGNSLNYKYRMHDPRVGRFFAVDPLFKKYPELTPYQFSSNKVIQYVELEGLEAGVRGGGSYVAAQLYMDGKISKEEYYEVNGIRGIGTAVSLGVAADLATGGNVMRFLGMAGTGMALGDFYEATLETDKAYEAMARGDEAAAEKHLIQAGEYSKGMIFEGLGGLTGYTLGQLFKAGKAFLQVSKGSDEFLNFSISTQDEIIQIGEAGLNNGTLEMDFLIPYELQGQGLGTEMFETAFNIFEDGVQKIQGLWVDGDNLKIFNEALGNGKSMEEAAFETITGKWAKDKGFDTIDKIVPIKSKNTDEILSVKVLFSKGKTN